GYAIAGGCVIALAADFRLMAEGSWKIGVPELLVGVPFPAAALEIVRFAVPRHRLQSLIYTGQTLSVQDALGAGLINEAVVADVLLSRAPELAKRRAAIPPRVYGITKRSLRAETLERIEKTKDLQDQAAAEIWAAPETHDRIREYLRKTVGK